MALTGCLTTRWWTSAVGRGAIIGLLTLAALNGQGAAADEPARIAEERGSPARPAILEPLPFTRRGQSVGPTVQAASDGTLPQPAQRISRADRHDHRAAMRALPPPRAGKHRAESSATASRSPRWLAQRLGVALVLFFTLVLVQRRWMSKRHPTPCYGMVQVCGKVPLDAKQSLHLVRIGERLLVLLESPQNMQCVAEITDPAEVRRLLDSDTSCALDTPRVNARQVLSTFRQRESASA